MKFIDDLFLDKKRDKDAAYLLYLLFSVIILALIIPTIIFRHPSGTDVYTHMYNTLLMADSTSVFDFYEKSFMAESQTYDYPFGMWLFGSLVMKVTGMGISELSYVFPLILSIGIIYFYYIYAYRLVSSKKEAILSSLFMVSMPIVVTGLLNYSTSRFVPVILIPIIILALDKPNIRSVLIQALLVFSLVVTHAGTYLFLMFFSMAYFILYALIWKKFDKGMYILILNLLFIYILAVNVFTYIHPQYIDKGTMVLTISESVSRNLGLEIVKDMGIVFYEKIFVENSFIYAIFWSSLIFFSGRLLKFIHSKIESMEIKKFYAIPIISNIKNVSHGIITAPFWIGPLHVILSIFGFHKIDTAGKCIALSLVFTALFPGAMQSGEGTGSLREIYYLYLIIPITSAIGFYYMISVFEKYLSIKQQKNATTILILLVFISTISAPIIGIIYYGPTLSGTDSEKEDLTWLSKIGNPTEGVPGFAYRERIDLYANKLTPDIPAGSETKRYLNDLKRTYFYNDSEEYTKDLYSFNLKYLISSERILKGFENINGSVTLDSNKKLDKIYSSENNFGFYKYITPPETYRTSISDEFQLDFNEASQKIQDFGSSFLVENEFYKIKLGQSSPEIRYLGTKTKNFLGEGGSYDFITISWNGAYLKRYASYNLNELNYPDISIYKNQIIYKTVLKDEKDFENWATLIVKYTFHEKAITKEIILANDWVTLDKDLSMYMSMSNSIFAPISDFEFNQIESAGDKSVTKKIYPSQDAVILKDKKFNEIYLNENGEGIYIKYSDSKPYPTRLSYMGSTMYKYGTISVDSSNYLSPAESMHLIQDISVGEKSTASNNIAQYTSINPYLYPEGEIPVIFTGWKNDDTFSSDIINKFKVFNIPYNQLISKGTTLSPQNGIFYTGYNTFYDGQRDAYKPFELQKQEIQNMKESLNVNGLLFFQYNLDTIRALSENKMIFADSLMVSSPFMEFFREGLRHPKTAYYHGNETGVVFLPITLPISSSLRPGYEVDELFTQWEDTLSSVYEDEGIANFYWNSYEIGNPNYINRIMDLINIAKSKNMTFTIPETITSHFILMKKIATNVTVGIDYIFLNASNLNQEEIKGVTYRLDLPAISFSCPYSVSNGRISRMKMDNGKCRFYVSFDLGQAETKEVKIEPNTDRNNFDLDFNNVYEGNNVITIRDISGEPVDRATIYIDAHRFESDNKGKTDFSIRRGIHSILVEKPGFNSLESKIEVRGRIYKYIGNFSNIPSLNLSGINKSK